MSSSILRWGICLHGISSRVCIYIMMIVLWLSVLQLCVTFIFYVLTGKALCKKDEDAMVLYHHQHYYNKQSVQFRELLCVFMFCGFAVGGGSRTTSSSWKMPIRCCMTRWSQIIKVICFTCNIMVFYLSIF